MVATWSMLTPSSIIFEIPRAIVAERSEIASGGERRTRALMMRDLLDQFARATDVADDDAPEIFCSLGIREADLFCNECDRLGRFDARARRNSGVAIQPAGYINRQHRNAGLFHRFDDRAEG